MVKPGLSHKRQRTRAALIDATLAIIDERGFAAATLDEIAARAGVSKGAIYSNYRGKGELLWDAVGRKALHLTPEIIPGAPLQAHARAIARALMALTPQAEREAAFHSELQIYIRTDPELRALQTAQYKTLFDTIAQQLEAELGDRLIMPPRTLGLAVQALGLGFIGQWNRTPAEVTEDTVAAAYEALVIGATSPR